MSLNPDLRLSLLELVHTLEELLTRPLREQQYKPDLGRIAAVAQLTLGQARHMLSVDDESQASFAHSDPLWCPPEMLGERLRERQLSRQTPSPYSPRRPRV